jgi:exodeoxyribonuclease VII small subunit
VAELDKNNVPLEQALDLFGEGIELVKHCNKLLDSAEAKVKVLLEDGSGELTTQKLIIAENDLRMFKQQYNGYLELIEEYLANLPLTEDLIGRSMRYSVVGGEKG